MDDYEEVLKRIVFLCHKRKMLKDIPSQHDWIMKNGLSAVELLDLLEMVGDKAMLALSNGKDK